MTACLGTSRITAFVIATCAVLLFAGCSEAEPRMQVTGGDAARGKTAIQRYGCVACHTVPGIANPGSNVGPPLADLALRGYIGGVLPNTPEDLVRWLMDPPAIDPRTAMPDVGLSEAEARDVAAYLYTLD
jgi:cytochrome c2